MGFVDINRFRVKMCHNESLFINGLGNDESKVKIRMSHEDKMRVKISKESSLHYPLTKI